MLAHFAFRFARWILPAFFTMGILVGHPQAAVQSQKQAIRAVTANAPEWYNVLPSLQDTLIARGKGKSNDQQVAIDKAIADARSSLARVIEQRWKELLRTIEKEGGAHLEWTSAPVALAGSRVVSQKVSKRGKVWTAYVLVGVPEGSARQVLLQRLHGNTQWYEAVRNTEAVRACETPPP